MAKQTNPIRLAPEPDTTALTINMRFLDRESEKEVFSFVLDGNRVHRDQRNAVFLYGLQKLAMDRTSDSSGLLPEGRSVAMSEVLKNLELNVWASERKGSGPTVSLEVQALAELKGVPVSAIQTSLRALPADRRAAVLANAAVKAKAAEIAARTSEVTFDDLT